MPISKLTVYKAQCKLTLLIKTNLDLFSKQYEPERKL